jgi:serine/threonine protein kinase
MIKVKKIPKKLAKTILKKSSLPKRHMCSMLEAIYIGENNCDGVYIITDNKIGADSLAGNLYQTCCSNRSCDYVAKWQPLPFKLLPDGSNIHPLMEAEIQYKVAKLGMAPMVREIWQCDNGIIIIMDAMKYTALKDITELSQDQIKKTAEFYGMKSKNILEIMEKNKNFEVKGEDTKAEKNKKIKIIKNILDLIYNLHNHKISHGDCHLNNFMRNQEYDYKFIDFGLAREDACEYNIDRDFLDLKRSLNNLIYSNGYKNLEYLIDLIPTPK